VAKKLFWPLLAAGFLSVIYWSWSEIQGHGDLRPYLFVQFGMIVASIFIFLLFKAEIPSRSAYLALLISYAAAKLAESWDQRIWDLTSQNISGHPIKHLIAGFGCYLFIRNFHKVA
jgi:hypothetical protein